ncbi:MAG: 50S ribosomal protein L9 [bacterium]
MRVILMEDIDTLGKAGAVVNVKPGYARNFLLPRRLAAEATEGSLRLLEHQKRVVAARHARIVKEAQGQADALAGVALSFERQAGGEGRLFGSVTSIDIHRELEARGHKIDRKRIHLVDPLKALGDFEVPVKLASGIIAKLKVTVLPLGGAPAARVSEPSPAA